MDIRGVLLRVDRILEEQHRTIESLKGVVEGGEQLKIRSGLYLLEEERGFDVLTEEGQRWVSLQTFETRREHRDRPFETHERSIEIL